MIQNKINTARNIYKLLKSEFRDLPKSKIVIHTTKKYQKVCNGTIGSAYAHAHSEARKNSRYKNQICIQQKFLCSASLMVIAEMMAHEAAHLVIKGNHGKRWEKRYERHYDFLKECKKNGELERCEE